MKKNSQKLSINRKVVSLLNPGKLAGIKAGNYNGLQLNGITETLSQLLSCLANCPMSFPPRCSSDVS
jgi:hypothetical protein